ncbi:retrotransposon gag domain, retroviral aspartyl protease [Tanacetum coccineum]
MSGIRRSKDGADDNSSGANDPIATQLAAIAAKLEAMESLKEDIADLKRQAVTKQTSGGGGSRYEEVESSYSNHNRRPFHKIEFPVFSGGDPRDWILKTEKYFRFYNTLDEEKVDVKHFGPPEFQNLDEYLCSIKQTGSVHEYRQEFARRSARISNWPDHWECFRCGDKYGPGYQCKTGTFKLLEADGVEEPTDTQEVNLDENLSEVAKISLHAIFGKSQPTTMKVHGTLNSNEVLILIDGESTHNFISDVLVNELKLTSQMVAPFGVQIRNGDVIRCIKVCRDLSLQLGGLKVVQDFYPFSIGGADVVLGIQWLATLNTVQANWKEMFMIFTIDGKQYKLQAEGGVPWARYHFRRCSSIARKKSVVQSWPIPTTIKEVRSKGFSPSNRFKSAYDRELLALVLAVQKWNHYLLGHHFLIRTDHYTLKFLLEQRITSPEQQRLLLKLMPYDFSIIHRAGKENRGADALSRRPHTGTLLTLTVPYCVEVAEIKSGLQTDPYTSDIIQKLLSPDSSSVSDFSFVDQFLFYKRCLVIPNISNLKVRLLHEAHDTPSGGHGAIPYLSATKVPNLVSCGFASTLACSYTSLGRYFDGLHCGFTTIRDVVFLSHFWQELFWLTQTKLQLSTSYHPQIDGQTEVINRGLEAYLRCFAHEQPVKWRNHLHFFLMSWGTTNAELEQQLVDRDDMLKLIRHNLHKVQDPHDPVSTDIAPLPITKDWEIDIQPHFVLAHHWVYEAKKHVLELLISWCDRPQEEAT